MLFSTGKSQPFAAERVAQVTQTRKLCRDYSSLHQTKRDVSARIRRRFHDRLALRVSCISFHLSIRWKSCVWFTTPWLVTTSFLMSLPCKIISILVLITNKRIEDTGTDLFLLSMLLKNDTQNYTKTIKARENPSIPKSSSVTLTPIWNKAQLAPAHALWVLMTSNTNYGY